MSEPNTSKAFHGENPASMPPPGTNENHIGVVERSGVDRLFLDYYGLVEQPFGVTPDLRFLYLGSKHRQSLDVLNYGTELNRGFLTLIAKPGMGKTSLLFHYLESLRGKARTAFLFQTDCTATELMRYLLADLGLETKGMDLPEMRAMLSHVLLCEMEAGRRFVLVIDEAQNLSEKVLESIRLLSNIETPWMKLMHIVLAGQPQLAERLASPSMAQLRQRISFAIRIEPFTREEVSSYIDHRLQVAGYKGAPLFSVGARAMVADHSEGIPRRINNACFCAMSYAWATKRKTVDRDTMTEVLADLDLEPAPAIEKHTFTPESPRVAPAEPKRSVQEERRVTPEERRIAPQDMPARAMLAVAPDPYYVRPSGERHRASGWMSRMVVIVTAFLALSWFGVQLNVNAWLEHSFQSLESTVRHYIDGTPASEPVPQVVLPESDVDSAPTQPDSGPNAKNSKAPKQNQTYSSRPVRHVGN